jgi:uncharacterized protein (TIGR03000 family)
MTHAHWVALPTLGIMASVAGGQEAAQTTPHPGPGITAAFVTHHGSFALHGPSGRAIYVRPIDPHNAHESVLTWNSDNGGIVWYLDKSTAYYVGFGAFPDCYWHHPVVFGYFSNKDFVWWYVGSSKRYLLPPRLETGSLDPLRVRPVESASLQNTQRASVRDARVVLLLPQGATLTVNGEAMAVKSETPRFVAPKLEVGTTYAYDVEAKVRRGGTTSVARREVLVRAGEDLVVDLREVSPASVAKGVGQAVRAGVEKSTRPGAHLHDSRSSGWGRRSIENSKQAHMPVGNDVHVDLSAPAHNAKPLNRSPHSVASAPAARLDATRP